MAKNFEKGGEFKMHTLNDNIKKQFLDRTVSTTTKLYLGKTIPIVVII